MNDFGETPPIPETENSNLFKALKNLEQLLDSPDPEIVDALEKTLD